MDLMTCLFVLMAHFFLPAACQQPQVLIQVPQGPSQSAVVFENQQSRLSPAPSLPSVPSPQRPEFIFHNQQSQLSPSSSLPPVPSPQFQAIQPNASATLASFSPSKNDNGIAFHGHSESSNLNNGHFVASNQVKASETSFILSDPMLSLALRMTRCANEECNKNVVFSPLSISTTLTLVLMGTSGNSYNQLRSALEYHKDSNDEDLNRAYRYLMDRIRSLDAKGGSSVLLNVANGIFSQPQSSFSNDFINNARNFFKSEVEELDIMRNPQGSASIINNWVANHTNGKITNILSSLPPDTQLVVANAVYFNANWAEPFAPDLTRPESFFVSEKETLTVPTMLQHGEVAYGESIELGCKIIGIPYKGEELGMYILLPTEQNGLRSLLNLESKLQTAKAFEDLFSKMQPRTVSIRLPKFRIQQKLQLKNFLRSVGVTDLFSVDTANLSRMMSKRGAALDDVIHQTFIEVTESGTEAAAATVLNLSRDGPSKSFVANQPFLFLVRDIQTKSILFYGRVVRPNATFR